MKHVKTQEECNIGQHRTNIKRTSCLHFFRHLSQKASGIHKVFPAFFVSSAEKSDGAIRTLLLCGIAIVERNGQLVIALNVEKMIPENAPVRLADTQLEELDYRRLYGAYSPKGRNPATDPRVMFKVLAYAAEEPFLHALKRQHGEKYKKVTADAGYESLDNYLYLEENGQMSFIKPQNHEQAKTKKYRSQIGRMENMAYDEEADTYTCAMGKTLSLYRESKDKYSKHDVEGAFGLLKNDFGFRRFLTRGKKNVRTELFLLALGFNLKKYWKKREAGRLKTHLSELNTA